MPPELASIGPRRERWFALALLCLLALTVLAEPLFKFRTHTYTSADLTQDYVLTSWDAEARYVENRGLCDPPLEMQPWLLFNRQELAAGRLPLWNPYNGNGVPHHANYQSAVFSPFSLPYYLLSFKAASIAAALARLILLGLFTYLFLRALALGFWPAIVGAAAFMLSGKSVLLLAYPHSAVDVSMPAALWCVERAAQALEQAAPARVFAGWIAGLCAAFVVGICAGHPEPLVFVVLLAAGWAAWRALGLRRRGARGSIRLAGGFVGAGLIALLVGAPQILPFFEYLQLSVTAATRVPLVQPSLIDWWPLLVYPTAVGAPLAGLTIRGDLPTPHFEQVNSSYAGGAVIALALLGLACLRSDARGRLFALGLAVWLVLTCDLGGLGALWNRTPVLGNTVLLSRSQSVWHFGLAVLAAVALERLLGGPATARWRAGALAVVLVATAGLTACTWRAVGLLAEHVSEADRVTHANTLERIADERLWLGGSSALAILLIGALLVAARRALKLGLACALTAVIGFQNGWMQHDYNPTVPDRSVYPLTPSISELRRQVGERNLLIMTDNGLPPDTNLAYRIAQPPSYDALGVMRYEELQTLLFGSFGAWRTPKFASREALATFGIEYVATPGTWVPIGTALGRTALFRDAPLEPISVQGQLTVEQSFVCDRNGLSAVSVLGGALRRGRPKGFELRLRLLGPNDELIAERTWSGDEIRAEGVREVDIAYAWSPFAPTRAFLARWLTLEFEPQRGSRTQRYRLVVDAPSSNGEDAGLVWRSSLRPYPHLELRIDGAFQPSLLAFDYRGNSSMFEEVAALGPLRLSRFTPSLGAFFAVSTAIECEDNVQAARVVSHRSFNPYRTVALERDAGRPARMLFPSPAAGGDEVPTRRPLDEPGPTPPLPEPSSESEPPVRAEILSRTPTKVRLRVTRRDGGWLVACQTWFPGWKATVDGVERPVRIANYAFQAVELGPGTSEVVLRYEPESLRVGGWLALAGTALGVAAFWALARGRSTTRATT